MYALAATAPLSISHNRIKSLQQKVLHLAFINLLLVALLGLLLRSFPFIAVPLDYKYLLHGHSHFAFGGWVMPLLLWLVIQYFPNITTSIAYHHWRNIVVMIFVSAYGMLASFPFQGYGVVSIIFSTISVFAGYYLAVVITKATAKSKEGVPVKFLRAGVFYLTLSSIGPFATGPLIAMGKAGTPVYFDAIYFYLHFQYNGWFSFVILAVLLKIMEEKKVLTQGSKIFTLFNIACAPTFFLSLLWHQPAPVFYVAGGAAALLQLVAFYFLLQDFKKLKQEPSYVHRLLTLALIALSIKLLLQALSALPFFADMAFHYRNFIIAYLHLVMLGFISVAGFAFILRCELQLLTRYIKTAVATFLFSFVTTELILLVDAVAQLFKKPMPGYTAFIFGFSIFFPIAILLMVWNVYQYNRRFISLATSL